MSLSRLLGSIMMRGMVIDMNDKQLATLAQLQAFLDGTTAVDFAVAPEERYDFIARIPQRFVTLVNAFCRDHLNPYLNFHRPCLFAETIIDDKGRQRKRYPYRLMMTRMRNSNHWTRPSNISSPALPSNGSMQRLPQ